MERDLVRYYRTADAYERFTVASAERRQALGAFYRRHRRFFGRSVLDLACGGGVLGSILEGSGRSYVGIDANPDMIRAARAAARREGSTRRFLQGDATRARIPGRFDTLALLGNALGHLTVADMSRLLGHRARNVHGASTLLIDYRDVVAMLWDGTWSHGPYVQRHKRGTVIARSRSLDSCEGVVRIRARPSSGAWSVEFPHAAWSPYILEAIAGAHGWELVRRRAAPAAPGQRPPWDYWEEVYRRRPRPRGAGR